MKRINVRSRTVNCVNSAKAAKRSAGLGRVLKASLLLLAVLVLLLPALPPVLASGWNRVWAAAESLSGLFRPAGATTAAAQLPREQRFIHIPFFMEGGDFTSVLTLNNNMNEQTGVDVTLFNLSGDALPLPPITLPPQLATRFDIGELAKGPKAGQFRTGNVQVTFDGVSMGVTAQVSVVSASRRMAFESAEDEGMGVVTSRLDGILWVPDARARASVALTNTSDRQLEVSGTASGGVGDQTLSAELGPHATQVIDATRFVVAGAAGGSAQSDSPSSGSSGSALASVAPALLTLEHNGNPGDLIVTGFVTDDSTGFSCNLPFVDSATAVSNQLAGAHFRIGLADASEGFPKGTSFSAPLVLANVGNQPSQAAVLVDYTINSVPHRVQLGVVTLNQRDTKTIDLAAELAARGITGPLDDAGLDVLYSGAPGTVIGRLVSVDQTGDYSFDVPVKDPLAGMARAGGSYPWRLDNGYSTVVHLKNVLDKPVQAIVQIRYDGGTYNPERISLQAHQTIAIDIAAMRDAQKVDIRNSVMPKDVTTGQVIWWELTPGSLIGRAEISSVKQGIAGSFSCGTGSCPAGFNGASVSPGSMTAAVGGTGSFLAQETDRDCFGSLFGPYNVNATWSSSNTSVVTVDSSGNASCVGPGTAGLTASWTGTVYQCDAGLNCSTTTVTASPAASVTVFIPKLVGAFQSLVSGDGNATISGRTFTLQVEALDPNGHLVQSFTDPVTVTFPSPPLISGESISQNPVQMSGGLGTTNITLKVVDGTPATTPTRTLDLSDRVGLATAGIVRANVWFPVAMDIERWKNCNFSGCPNLSSYFCTTSCVTSGFSQPTSFVALTSKTACGAAVMVIDTDDGMTASTAVDDVGPTTGNAYWQTGSIPAKGGCLSDQLADSLGVSNGCSPAPFGHASVLWRFQ